MLNAMDTSWQDRIASGAMIKQLLKDLDMNQTQGARFLGIGLRTMRRFTATRKSIAPVSVILLLRLMVRHNEMPLVPDKRRRKR